MVVAFMIGAAAVVVAAVVVTAAATAMHGLKFLRGGVADSKDFTVEAHSLSGQRVIEVHFHVCGGSLPSPDR